MTFEGTLFIIVIFIALVAFMLSNLIRLNNHEHRHT